MKVEFGMVYKWCPASMVVECGCSERVSLNRTAAICPGCGEDHEDIIREETEAGRLIEEAGRPWRDAMEREVAVTGTVY
jgi:hypothetical protein